MKSRITTSLANFFKRLLRIRACHLKIFLLLTLFSVTHCKFDQIEQPGHAHAGEVIEIRVTISDNIDETTNPHKGVLCVLVPEDWAFVSANYFSTIGNGEMQYSSEWADSAEACYPAADFDGRMKWIALISDTGYTYQNNPQVLVELKLRVGYSEGCFGLAYLATKATRDLICTNWSPFSFPHWIGVPQECDSSESYQAKSAPEWDSLFNRSSGWTGSDAAYSIPLSGYDAPSAQMDEKTLFVFGDTFVGEVDSLNHRRNTVMIRNSYGILHGKKPHKEKIDFFWKLNDQGKPASVFEADTPQSNPGDWIWPMDGICLNDRIYVFGLRLQSGATIFEVVATTLISFEFDSTGNLFNYQHIDAPIYYYDITRQAETVLGQAVMVMTESSGNPFPDGYIYIYGPRSLFGKKELVAARVLPEDIENFSQWTFWDGDGWVADITACQTITDGISQEFSVSPLQDGRFLLVFESGGKVGVRFGESPVGPFGVQYMVYDCPELNENPNIFVYNAKAHPHLSTWDEMLISYNVNSWDWWDLLSNADIYRPRFVKLNITGKTSPVKMKYNHIIPPIDGTLMNYPNPFNSLTQIRFSLKERKQVNLSIYNILGERVITLIQNESLSPGVHTVLWNCKDLHGSSVASGIYFYRLQFNDGGVYISKMALLE
ncbi:MAG TPA: DUF4185 domain-containing protein [bacterium]|nr:DUF4185 domain-containing protein [bacterium]